MTATAPMLKNGRANATDGICYDGCSYHNDKATRRRAKRPAKRREQRAVAAEIHCDRSAGEAS